MKRVIDDEEISCEVPYFATKMRERDYINLSNDLNPPALSSSELEYYEYEELMEIEKDPFVPCLEDYMMSWRDFL